MATVTKRSVKRAKAAKNNDAVKEEFSVKNAAVQAAINSAIDAELNIGGTTLRMYRPFVQLVNDGKASGNDAEAIYSEMRALMARRFVKAGVSRELPAFNKQRVGEMRSIMRMGDWKVWPNVWKAMGELNVDGVSTIVVVSKWMRENYGRTEKGDVTVDDVRKAISALRIRQAENNAKKAKDRKRRDAKPVAWSKVNEVNVVDSVANVMHTLDILSGQFKDSATRKLIAAARSNVANMRKAAAALMAARKQAAEEKREAEKAKRDAAKAKAKAKDVVANDNVSNGKRATRKRAA